MRVEFFTHGERTLFQRCIDGMLKTRRGLRLVFCVEQCEGHPHQPNCRCYVSVALLHLDPFKSRRHAPVGHAVASNRLWFS